MEAGRNGFAEEVEMQEIMRPRSASPPPQLDRDEADPSLLHEHEHELIQDQKIVRDQKREYEHDEHDEHDEGDDDDNDDDDDDDDDAVLVEKVGAGREQDPMVHVAAFVRVVARFAYEAQRASDLALMKGDVVVVRRNEQDARWWTGLLLRTGRIGRFPSNYVRVLPDDPAALCELAATHPRLLRDLAAWRAPRSGTAGRENVLAAASTDASEDCPLGMPPHVVVCMEADDEEAGDEAGERTRAGNKPSCGKDGVDSVDRVGSGADASVSMPRSPSRSELGPVQGRVLVQMMRQKLQSSEAAGGGSAIGGVKDMLPEEVYGLAEAARFEMAHIVAAYLRNLESVVADSGVGAAVAVAERTRLAGLADILFSAEALRRSCAESLPVQMVLRQRQQDYERLRPVLCLQAVVRGWLARRRYSGDLRKLRMRRRAAFEILETERSYVRSLRLVVEQFKLPLEQSEVIDDDESRALFANVELILGVSEELLRQLEERVGRSWAPSRCVGDIFLKLAPYMKLYTEYVNNYENSIGTYESLMDSQPDFAEIMGKCMSSNPSVANYSFDSFQIMPIQRVPRYVLLLSELSRHTPKTHPDAAHVQKALEMMHEVASRLNDAKRVAENMRRVLQIQNLVTGARVTLLAPHRRYVYEGAVQQIPVASDAVSSAAVSGLPRYLYLFSDKLLVTERRRNFLDGNESFDFRDYLSLSKMSVRDEASLHPLQFGLAYDYGVVARYRTETHVLKEAWLSHLTLATTGLQDQEAKLESVRRVLLSPSAMRAQLEVAGEAAAAHLRAAAPPASASAAAAAAAQPAPLPPRLCDVLAAIRDLLDLQAKTFQYPIEVQRLVPQHLEQLQPQQLQQLSGRLVALQTRLAEMRVISDRIADQFADEQWLLQLDRVVHVDGHAAVGALREWVQHYYPRDSREPVAVTVRSHVANLLKFYVALQKVWNLAAEKQAAQI